MSGEMDVWAVVEHEKPLQKIRLPIPKPKGTEVLIKVTHCGVCHSDLHFWEGWYDIGDGKRFKFKDRGATLPRAMGHEILGNIEKAGPDAGHIDVGARRIVYPWVGCGSCEKCDREEDNMCLKQRSLGVLTDGGFAEYVLVPHPRYLVDPGDLDPAIACTFGCSGITTLSAVKKVMPMVPEQPVILFGAGGLGLAAISMLRAIGHENIISIDISVEKLAAARKAGASSVVDASKGELETTEGIKAAAGGLILHVIDFVNSEATASVAQAILGKGGKWVQVGMMGGQVKLNLVAMILKATTILGNLTGNPQHLREITQIAQNGQLPPIPVETVPWDDAETALVRLRSGNVTGRLVLVKP